MNIKATNSTAVSKVTTDIKIKYRMSTRGTETVKDVTAEISNDETEEVKQVFQTAIDDCSEVLK